MRGAGERDGSLPGRRNDEWLPLGTLPAFLADHSSLQVICILRGGNHLPPSPVPPSRQGRAGCLVKCV